MWRREDYEALFDAAPPGTLRGEFTPFYLYDRRAQQRIRALIPGARLIAILRDPVERAHYQPDAPVVGRARDPVGDFPAACAAEETAGSRRAGSPSLALHPARQVRRAA